MDREILRRLISLFTQEHPEGFNSESWRGYERYKLELRRDHRGDDNDGIDVLFNEIKNIKPKNFCQRLLSIMETNRINIKGSNLAILAYNRGGQGGAETYTAIKDMLLAGSESDEYAETIHNEFQLLIQNKSDYIQGFIQNISPIIARTKNHKTADNKCAFFVPMFFLAIYHKDSEILFKARSVRKLVEALKYDITIGNELRGYLSAKQFFVDLRQALTEEGQQPNDNIDVQGFIWQSYEENVSLISDKIRKYWLFNLNDRLKWEYARSNNLALMHYDENDPKLESRDVTRSHNIAMQIRKGDFVVGYIRPKYMVSSD